VAVATTPAPVPAADPVHSTPVLRTPTPRFSAFVPGEALFLDDEKVVLDWPDVSGRVIEELR
jgi:hypothetical protein